VADLACSPLRSAPRYAPALSFSATPAPRSAPLHPIFGPLRSVFRSAHAPLSCSAYRSSHFQILQVF